MYSAEEEAILAAQLAHGACKVSSVDAPIDCILRIKLRRCALFASRFRGRADMQSCAKDDGNNYRKVYVIPKGHSHGVFIAVCTCRQSKVIGVFIFSSVESLIVIASVLLTYFCVLPDFVFYDATCLRSYSISLRFPSFLSRALFATDVST
jgi:hypothetical protein